MQLTDKYRMLDNKLIWHPDILDKWRNDEPFVPIHLDIGVTSRCNYRCVHCFYDYLSHKPRDLSRDVLVQLMKDIAAAGVRSIFFASQGEPLLNKALPEAAAVADENNIDVALSSNGSLFSKDISEIMLQHLRWVRVSVLAFSKENYCKLHGTTEKVWDSVFRNLADMAETVKKNNLSTVLGTQTCLLPESAEEIVPLARYMKEIGFHYITFRPISNHPSNTYHVTDDVLAQFRESLKEAEALSDDRFHVVVRWNLGEENKTYSQCRGLPFIAFVNADGGIYSCGCRLDESDSCYGNIHDKRFHEIWHSRERAELTRQLTEHPDFSRCDVLCRHHAINKFLEHYANVPHHVNFI